MEKEKVYCKDCKYCFIRWSFGDKDYECIATVKVEVDYVTGRKSFSPTTDCLGRNPYGDCKLFEYGKLDEKEELKKLN